MSEIIEVLGISILALLIALFLMLWKLFKTMIHIEEIVRFFVLNKLLRGKK